MVDAIGKALVAAIGGGGIVVVFIFINPEAAEKWLSIISRPIVSLFHIGEKRYAALDVQGRMNEFVREIRDEFPHIASVGVKITWVDTAGKESSLREENKLILRMRRHEDQDKNFVQASMVFIASEFLSKTKKSLSKSQSESLDLFFAKKLFERERPRVVDKFFDEYFFPATEKPKIVELLERYDMVEKVGLFFPVLVQELVHLGEKVYFKPRKDAIITEVNAFIEFLEKYSHRRTADNITPTNFIGAYLRCGIVLIAKKMKREDGNVEPYIHYVGYLLGRKIETIYLLGSAEENNAAFMQNVIRETCSRFDMELSCKPMKVEADIKRHDGERHHVHNYVVSLRSRETQRTYDSEYQALYINSLVEPEKA